MTQQTGAEAIAAERRRQIEEEGYTAEHDSRHSIYSFVTTAAAYLGQLKPEVLPRFEVKRANPGGVVYERRDLVKAGALIAAAIDRLDQIHEARR